MQRMAQAPGRCGRSAMNVVCAMRGIRICLCVLKLRRRAQRMVRVPNAAGTGEARRSCGMRGDVEARAMCNDAETRATLANRDARAAFVETADGEMRRTWRRARSASISSCGRFGTRL